jgi:biotin transporter BioY
MDALIHSFVTDQQFKTIVALIVVDLVIGVAAAFKLGTFRLTYLANFARNDLLGKVFPFFVFHSAAVVSGGTDIVIPGLDVSKISDGIFLFITAALAGSILKSLADFGLPIPAAIGGSAPESHA